MQQSRYRPFEECLICRGDSVRVLADVNELEGETRERDRICRSLFKPNTPDYILKDHVFFTHTYSSRLVVCTRCGLVYRDPRLAPQAAIQEYRSDPYHSEWLDASFAAYYHAFARRLPSLTRRLGRPRVLEVGSHVGGFLAAATEAGWEATGVDVGECVSAFARSKSLNVLTSTIEQAGFASESFDAVFVWVCFDQLPDPWKDLEQIHRVLRRGGHLLGKVPNGDFLKVAQRLIRLPIGRLRLHLRKLMAYSILLGFPFQIGYTPSTLRSLLNRSGFSAATVRNQMYIPVTNSKYANPFALYEEMRYIRVSHLISQIFYYGSGGLLLRAPWIEFHCRKRS